MKLEVAQRPELYFKNHISRKFACCISKMSRQGHVSSSITSLTIDTLTISMHMKVPQHQKFEEKRLFRLIKLLKYFDYVKNNACLSGF